MLEKGKTKKKKRKEIERKTYDPCHKRKKIMSYILHCIVARYMIRYSSYIQAWETYHESETIQNIRQYNQGEQ